MTERQIKFVDAYLKTKNAKQAALDSGYKPSCAASMGSMLLANPLVVKEIGRKSAVEIKRAEVDAGFVISELRKIAEQEDVAQGTKVRALELLAKHLGMLEERVTIKTDGLSPEQRAERVAILLERVRSR